MLYGQCSQVRIGYKIGGCIPIMKHLLQNAPVPFRRMNHPDAWLVNPALYAVHGFFQGQWALMQTGVRRDANEGRKDWPA
jgi:hypothetical protein